LHEKSIALKIVGVKRMVRRREITQKSDHPRRPDLHLKGRMPLFIKNSEWGVFVIDNCLRKFKHSSSVPPKMTSHIPR